jgi:hypothetical protein
VGGQDDGVLWLRSSIAELLIPIVEPHPSMSCDIATLSDREGYIEVVILNGLRSTKPRLTSSVTTLSCHLPPSGEGYIEELISFFHDLEDYNMVYI